MEINYIILAHKEPYQLRRLVERLSTENTSFYIHVDRNIDITPFEEALKNKANVNLLSKQKRVASIWGSPGLVMATLQAMREIVRDNRIGYAVLLSGQCYPIKSNEHIAAFFKENYGYNFIEGFELPDPRWPSSTIRMQQYAFFLSAKKEDFLAVPSLFDQPVKALISTATIRKYLKAFLHFPVKSLVVFRKRRFPQSLKPVGGMQWWALPIETLKFILKYVDENPAYLKYHAFTLFSDEIFFHTLVYNFYDKIKGSTTFSSWSEEEASSSPHTLTSADITILKESPALFARKFEYSVDAKVLDLIDGFLLQENEKTGISMNG